MKIQKITKLIQKFIDVMRQSACFVITTSRFAFLCNCTPIGHEAGSTIYPTFSWMRLDIVYCLVIRGSTGDFLLLRCFGSGIVSVKSSPVLSMICLFAVLLYMA